MVSVILRKPKSHWISYRMCKKLKKFSMKRYLLVVLSLALLSCSQDDQPVSSLEPIDESFYEWKMITSWPKNLPALGTSPEYFAEIVETNNHSIRDILQESLAHELNALSLYKELLNEVEGSSVYLEEYARGLIGQEEQHQLELKKMLKDFS